MNSQQQAHLSGFIAKAAAHGIPETQAIELYKSASISGSLLGSVLRGIPKSIGNVARGAAEGVGNIGGRIADRIKSTTIPLAEAHPWKTDQIEKLMDAGYEKYAPRVRRAAVAPIRSSYSNIVNSVMGSPVVDYLNPRFQRYLETIAKAEGRHHIGNLNSAIQGAGDSMYNKLKGFIGREYTRPSKPRPMKVPPAAQNVNMGTYFM